MKTIQQLAQLAIDVQDSCNLSGVVHSFSKVVLPTLWEKTRTSGHGTDWVNTHPISILYANKIAQLTGVQNASVMNITKAFVKCHNLAEGSLG